MKFLTCILISWAVAGFIYLICDILTQLNHEALIDPYAPTPIWKEVAYGPLYWVLYLILSILAHLLRIILR